MVKTLDAACTNDEARRYFKDKGLTYDDVTEGDILTLVMLLNKYIKAAAKNGEMSTDSMHLSSKIDMRKKTNGSIINCYLYINSHYFTRRECISFNTGGFIGFAGWADSNNLKPILRAFIEWCDAMTEQKKVAQLNTSEFVKLVADNPDLKIIAWVESEVVAEYDSCIRWCGKFDGAVIKEYTEVEMYNNYLEFVYKDDTEDLESFLYDTTEMSDEEIAEYINNIEWQKAIFVYVDTL